MRNRFIETLNLNDETTIIPEDAHLLVAKGAALDSVESKPVSVEKLKSKIGVLKASHDNTSKPLNPLFTIDAEYEAFKSRHAKAKVKRKSIKNFSGDCFIGIDAGSTTTKLVVIDNANNLL